MALTVGVLNPGAMGAAFAAALKESSSVGRVICALKGRSAESRARAQLAGLEDVGPQATLCAQADVIFSVVPPAFALATAEACAAAGFRGIYCDANAVSPETALCVSDVVRRAGAQFVDGSIIGPPPKRAGTTRLYLSGALAPDVAALFAGTLLEPIVIPGGDSAASALKICFSAYHKGVAALLFNIRALARAEGVDDALLGEWQRTYPGLQDQLAHATETVPPKAWRFVEEMEEISASFERRGLSGGFHHGAADVFERMACFKGKQAGTVPLTSIVSAITKPSSSASGNSATGSSSSTAQEAGQDALSSSRKDSGTASSSTSSSAATLSSSNADNVTVADARHQSPEKRGSQQHGAGPSSPGKKLRILCLHGWRTSGAILTYQCRDFPADVADFCFVDGTHPAHGPPHEVVAAFFQGPYFEWWDKAGDVYQGLQESLDALTKYNQTHGPFDGVMGFSQGACLASILCALVATKGKDAPVPSLRFGILASGFVPRDATLGGLFNLDKPFNFPVILVHGADDFLKDGSEHLARFFANSQVAVHAGSHELPSNWNGPEALSEIKRFLRGMRF